MTKFNMVRDINGFNGFGLDFAENNEQMLLLAGVEQHFTVPNVSCVNGQSGLTNSWIAIFCIQAGGDVWVANNATAQVPVGAAAATTSQLNPTARRVKGGDVLSFITNDVSAEVGVLFYAL